VGKQPKSASTPRLFKEPRAAESGSYHRERPSWRIRRMEFADPFGWHALDAQRLEYVREKLSNFETMTWEEILVKAKKQNHSVSVADLCTDARDRLNVVCGGRIDVDELVSLRLTGKERVWGILDRGVLSLLWWDPDHSVCPSHAKD
jgi:hypothetical protein